MSVMTPAEMGEYIEAHRGTHGYEETANEAAYRVLLTFGKRPDTLLLRAMPEGDEPDLYEVVKAETDGLGDVSLSDLGLTGFQWGWAVNTAKYIVGAPPVPNPALMTIEVPSRPTGSGT